jgi:hypothetical protein
MNNSYIAPTVIFSICISLGILIYYKHNYSEELNEPIQNHIPFSDQDDL